MSPYHVGLIWKPKSDISNICIWVKKLYNTIDWVFGNSFSRDFPVLFYRMSAFLWYSFFMNRKLFFAIIIVFSFFLFIVSGFSVGDFFRIRGFFEPLDTWTGWHPGKVSFDLGTANSGYTSGIDTDGYLSGRFWLGNVWWGVFDHGVVSVDRAQVLCDDQVFKDPNTTCPLTGYAWSENAGWISLSGSWIDWGSGVYYNPASGLIEGFGHSSALGWIPFYATTSTPITATTQTWVILDGIGLNFIGKIAVIGNIAGTRIYNLPNQQVGYIFSSINHAEMLNTIRKNIALISRNIPDSDLTNDANAFKFFVHKTSDYDTSGFGWIWPPEKKTIIVQGHDLILDTLPGDAITRIGNDADANRAFIVLKDQNGNGGNVFIGENVKQIYSFIYAEWTIYSWYKTNTGVITPYVSLWVWNIPLNQLYIKWALISKNTIGWSLQSPSVCPVVINDCTSTVAQLFDFNYFRSYDPNDSSQRSVPYSDTRFNSASMVIDYNTDLASNPPPGIANVLQ